MTIYTSVSDALDVINTWFCTTKGESVLNEGLDTIGGNAVGRGSLNSDTQAQLKNATDEVLRLYVTVGVLVAVILVLLLAVIVLSICFCKKRSVVYTLPPATDNCYSPPPPSKQDQVLSLIHI